LSPASKAKIQKQAAEYWRELAKYVVNKLNYIKEKLKIATNNFKNAEIIKSPKHAQQVKWQLLRILEKFKAITAVVETINLALSTSYPTEVKTLKIPS